MNSSQALKRVEAIEKYEKSDKGKARKRKYYLKHREKQLAYQREYYLKTKLIKEQQC